MIKLGGGYSWPVRTLGGDNAASCEVSAATLALAAALACRSSFDATIQAFAAPFEVRCGPKQ